MDTEQSLPPIATWNPFFSPTARTEEQRSVAESSNSIGRSSLDTVSASPHMERFRVAWSNEDIFTSRSHHLEHQQQLHRARSLSGIAGQSSSERALRRRNLNNLRPLGGASRRRLIAQIQELTEGKAQLMARLEAMTSYFSSRANHHPHQPDQLVKESASKLEDSSEADSSSSSSDEGRGSNQLAILPNGD